MANGMGSLYIGASGLQNSQNALNTTANNLANVETKGYVRQQVLFEDRDYVTFDRKAAISDQQAGLGVNIADVVHTRNAFLDQYYRTENGRQNFYEACAESSREVENQFQELEGEQFQTALQEFWESFAEFSKAPEEGIYQTLVIQKATLFLDRAQKVQENLKTYQKNLNYKINKNIDRINEIGTKIRDLNKEILRIESGGVETAMTLRDERDNLLDELSGLAKVDFKERADGTVRVKLENVEFVDEIHVYEVRGYTDPVTGFITPYWPQLSDTGRGQYTYMFDYKSGDIAAELNTDIGALKGLIVSRGDRPADYRDITGMDQQKYEDTTGMSVVMTAQAELDQLIHEVVTSINDLFSPLTTASFTAADGTVYRNVKVWDEENGSVGTDGQKPGRELFTRRGCDRYNKVTANDGTVYYVYNEEDLKDTAKMYTTGGITINEDLLQLENALPHLKKNGEPDRAMAQALVALWDQKRQTINPSNTDPCTFKEYYRRMIQDIGTSGNVYEGLSAGLTKEVESIENSRQQVIGVSSDEELQNMIKYQNAYNAASRFINVISEMLEHIVTRL
jgi:flagellar hook-associated protein 1 FlgK